MVSVPQCAQPHWGEDGKCDTVCAATWGEGVVSVVSTVFPPLRERGRYLLMIPSEPGTVLSTSHVFSLSLPASLPFTEHLLYERHYIP